MANFDPPIASIGGLTRAPTPLERANGLQCGPADLKLFNFLFQKMQAELKAIQDAGGILGTDGDDTTVLQAILQLIASATGGEAAENYVTFPISQTRLPFFPEVRTNNGIIPVAPQGASGLIRIPAGSSILHRGIGIYSPGLTDLATVASKVYHLRWTPADGFVLKDLADLSYNPTLAPETSTIFDSTYDDMLVSRVVTNASNVPTITNLQNKCFLVTEQQTATFSSTSFQNAALPSTLVGGQAQIFDLNWARRPIVAIQAVTDFRASNGSAGEFNMLARADSRYRVRCVYELDGGAGGGAISFVARA